MRTLIGIIAGITLSIIIFAMKQPTLDMIFMRIPPATPADFQPRYWTTRHGVITKGEWT